MATKPKSAETEIQILQMQEGSISWAERTYRRIQRAERLFCVFWDKDRPFAVPATEAHVLRTRGEVQFDLATIGYYDSRCLPEWIEEDVRDFARSH